MNAFFKSSPPLRSASTRRSGMTMVELLVSMAVGIAVFGLLLAILDQTTRLSERSIAREALWREAVGAAQTIEQTLRGYASPGDLSIENPEKDVFGAEDAEFYSVGAWAGADVLRMRIGADPDQDVEPEGRAVVIISREPVSVENAGAGTLEEADRRVVFGSDESYAAIRFRFAYKIGKDLKPDWTEKRKTGKRPRLVEYTVTVSSREAPEGMPIMPVQLTGAVALGS